MNTRTEKINVVNEKRSGLYSFIHYTAADVFMFLTDITEGNVSKNKIGNSTVVKFSASYSKGPGFNSQAACFSQVNNTHDIFLRI